MRTRLLPVALAAIGVAVVLGAITATPVAATPTHANGQIAFARFNPNLGDTQVYVVNPDGTGQRLVQAPTDVGECPKWFSDGSLIATCGSSLGGGSTFINPDTGAVSIVDAGYPGLFNPCGSPSPDGALLLCETFSEDGSQNGIHTIRTSDGGGLTQITSDPGGDDIPGDWSPNGKRIVFCRTTLNALFVVNSNGTGLKQITPQDFLLAPGDFCGSWSPQGNEIVFSRQVTPDVHGSIWVVHADGTGLHEINVQPASACGGANADPNAKGCIEPTWSPDGTKIAFRRGAEIYTVNADGTGLTQVTHGSSNDARSEHPDWGTHPPTG